VSTETCPWKIALSDIDLGDAEERAVIEVLRSGWLTMGRKTAEFEQCFAESVGARHAVAVSSCTAALHLALRAVGIGPGDEVVLPSLTFVATANAVLYCGAEPVFADVISAECPLLDPDDARRKLTPATRAVLPVHYAGYPCDMDAFRSIASERGLALVEDAAHAPGASWRGEPIGSIGDASCFSFFSNKNLVTGEGGMLTTDDDAIAESARLNRSHGMTALSLDKQKGHAFTYDVVSAGYNYRLTEIESALGLAQLDKLEAATRVRRARTLRYHEALREIPGLVLPFAGQTAGSACHILPVVLPEGTDRDRVQRHMKQSRIQTSVHYPLVHRFSSFAGKYRADVPRTEALAGRLLTLPLHPLLGEEEVDAVCAALGEALDASAPGTGA
jgi:dTDP-4-amino-4,6-dideoxygalactose transaminase